MLYNNILETIGNTPLVRINQMGPGRGIEIFAKLEGQNPGGSIKDRVAFSMIKKAIENGKLEAGKTILEPTSGNTGIGLAMAGVVMGFPVTIVMSEAVSVERRKILQALGAQIVLTDPKKGTDGAIIKAKEMLYGEPKKYFMPDQFSNPSNSNSHYESTAFEIWDDMERRVDYVVASIGTSGTLMGLSEKLKELDPSIKIVCAYPEKNHTLQGLKNMEEAIVPPLYDQSKIDRFITVESQAAKKMAREIMKKEGILAGMSSGAALLAALELARDLKRGRIAVIFPDRAEKYLSTELFD